MTFATRMMLILTLMFAVAGVLSAQETTATTTAAAAEPAEAGEASDTAAAATSTDANAGTDAAPGESAPRNSYEIRNRFYSLVRENHPPEVGTILKLDPTLLANQQFLDGYPELARFLERYPEVRRNPRFYVAQFPGTAQPRSAFEEVFEVLSIFGAFGLAIFVFSWLVRTIIEQRRWNRLSRTQADVHNKILDRFGTSAELIEYMKTPAGTKFLESAPIPVFAEKPASNASAVRVLRSVQMGVVIAAGGLGVLLVSLRFDGETAHGFFAMGVIAFCIGAGFIASAAVSLFLSRRLALWQEGTTPESTGFMQ